MMVTWLCSQIRNGLFPALIAFTLSTSLASAGWRVNFDGSGSQPVIVEGLLYVGSADGAIYAFDVETGSIRWRFQTGEGLPSGPQLISTVSGASVADQAAVGLEVALARRATAIRRVDMTPAVANGTVFVGSGDNNFYALDAASGELRWSYPAGEGMASNNNTAYAISAPLVSNGLVYFVTRDGLHALDAETGDRRWMFETLQEVPAGNLEGMKRAPSAPVLTDDGIFLTAWPFLGRGAPRSSYLYALDPVTGALRWVATLEGTNVTAPVVVSQSVLVSTGGRLQAIDIRNGQIRWQLGGGQYFETQRLKAVGNRVYFATDKVLLAADIDSGQELWRFTAERMEGDLQADHRHVYLLAQRIGMFSTSTTLQALDQTTGRQQWSLNQRGYLNTITIHEDVLYAVGDQDLHAFNTATGRRQWSLRAAGALSSARVANGRVFVTSPTVEYLGSRQSRQGFLYAVEAGTGRL